ncbi:MAG: cob(I)yrinic acid a,c-diamide adenosyltransferase [Acidobacteriota bacterium]
MSRIYTKTGDDGNTGLIGGDRVSKASRRVEAYGTVDELNAILGIVLSYPLEEGVARVLREVQDSLFTLGANLALPAQASGEAWGIPPITDADVLRLEKVIDETEVELVPLRKFILPGGSAAGAMLHLARTVARRAERRCVALAAVDNAETPTIRYLNRLSDLCFVLARAANMEAGQAEAHPTFGKPDGEPSES